MAAPSDQEAVHTLLLTGVSPSGGVGFEGLPECGEAHGLESVGYGVLKVLVSYRFEQQTETLKAHNLVLIYCSVLTFFYVDFTLRIKYAQLFAYHQASKNVTAGTPPLAL